MKKQIVNTTNSRRKRNTAEKKIKLKVRHEKYLNTYTMSKNTTTNNWQYTSRQTANPIESVGGSSAIDRTALDFDNASLKVKKIKKLINTGEYDADVARYIPGTLDLAFQGMICKISTIEQPAHLSYKDKEMLDFQLLHDKNYYTNLNSHHICFPLRLRKLTKAAANLRNATLITVNNIFSHWIKEIHITKYGTNKQLIPTTTSHEIYQYSMQC